MKIKYAKALFFDGKASKMKKNIDSKKLDELWENAEKLILDGYEKKAFRMLLGLAKHGHVDSQNSVGYLLDHGIGVKKSPEEAMKWYRKGARSGDTIAAINIGITYLSRDNIPLAKSWFNRALQQGDKQAAYYLGKIYSKSHTKKSQYAAIEFLKLFLSLGARYSFCDERKEAMKILRVLELKKDKK